MALKKVAITQPGDFGFVPVGSDLTVRVDGEADAAADKIGLFVSVFYRINGIPFSQVLVNGPVVANASKLFTNAPSDTTTFGPLAMFHSLRAMAWDRVAAGPATSGGAAITLVSQVKTKLSRFKGIKTS